MRDAFVIYGCALENENGVERWLLADGGLEQEEEGLARGVAVDGMAWLDLVLGEEWARNLRQQCGDIDWW